MQTVGRIARDDPDVDNAYVWVQSNFISRGRMAINLKPSSKRRSKAQEIVARLKKRMAEVEGISASLQVRQDIRVGGRIGTAQYQYTLQDADVAELDQWSEKMLQAFRTLRELLDVDSDAQALATNATLKIDRDTAARLGVTAQAIDDILYDAFGQRQVATLFTQTNQYKVVEEVDPRFQLATEALGHLYVRSSTNNALVPLSLVAAVEKGVSPVTVNQA